MSKKDKYYLDIRTLVNGKKSIINLDNVIEILSKEEIEELVTTGGVPLHSNLILNDGTNPHGTTQSDVGLSNVDNTSDINKPISNATQLALGTKLDNTTTTISPTQAAAIVANTAKVSFPEAPVDGKQYVRIDGTWQEVNSSGGITKHSELILDDGKNPHGTTKTDVGLGNVPNTDFTSAVAANTAKVGITPTQAAEIAANTLKVSYGGSPNKRLVNATTSGTFNLNHSLYSDWKLTLTGAITLTDSNLPTGDYTIEFTMKITGSFGLTLPSYWSVNGDTYDGTKWNFFAIQVHKGDVGSEEVTVFITNLA